MAGHGKLSSKYHVRIGVWHVLPKQAVKRFAKELQLSEVSIVKPDVNEKFSEILQIP